MNTYDASTYGNRIAEVYDQLYPSRADTQAVVAALAQWAGKGPVLELGIGTGRVALPLAEQGIEVHGIDASEAMVAKLRAKPGGAKIPVSIGDFADVDIEGCFSMVFVVFNTFFGLLSQQEQVRCFRNVAAHLTDEGVFVIEAFVPDLTRFIRGQNVSVTSIETNKVLMDVTRHDAVNQKVISQHVVLSEQGIQLYPVQLRYAWPSELDLMAELAGLRLRQRWSDWAKTPFSAASTNHVSVYEQT